MKHDLLYDDSFRYSATDTLFTSRNYLKWIWTIHDDQQWIDESCKLNQVPIEKNMASRMRKRFLAIKKLLNI